MLLHHLVIRIVDLHEPFQTFLDVLIIGVVLISVLQEILGLRVCRYLEQQHVFG
jgi:hypothetical protein